MTRTHVDESELVDIGRKTLYLLNALRRLADRMDRDDNLKYLPAVSHLSASAREVSDQVDALCEYIRHSRMLD